MIDNDFLLFTLYPQLEQVLETPTSKNNPDVTSTLLCDNTSQAIFLQISYCGYPVATLKEHATDLDHSVTQVQFLPLGQSSFLWNKNFMPELATGEYAEQRQAFLQEMDAILVSSATKAFGPRNEARGADMCIMADLGIDITPDNFEADQKIDQEHTYNVPLPGHQSEIDTTDKLMQNAETLFAVCAKYQNMFQAYKNILVQN